MSTTTTTIDKITRGEKPATPVQKFSGFLDKLKPQIALALPRHMSADRMARLALTAFSSTPALQKCTPESIAGCIMVAAQLGLEPGVNGQAYLIPYGNKCTFVPGWKGLADLVARSGRAVVWTGATYRNDGDLFEYELGDSPFCKHKPSEDSYPDGAEWTHVYAIGRVKDAQRPVIEVWPRAKVSKHLAQYNKVGDRHYAKTNENNFEMYGRKVALLQVLKYMPSSIELTVATELSHASDSGVGMVIEGAVSDLAGAADPETGELHITLGSVASSFDYLAAIKKLSSVHDRTVLALMADEWRDLPASPERDALMSAYADRDAELGAA